MNHTEIIKPTVDEQENLLIESIIEKGKNLSLKSYVINRRELVD